MGKKASRPSDESEPQQTSGGTARAAGGTLTSCRVAALPVLDRVLRRLRLEAFLRDHLPREDGRSRIPTATGLLVLVKNLLISREPLYGVGEWAARHAPELLGTDPDAAPLAQRRPRRPLPRPALRRRRPLADPRRRGARGPRVRRRVSTNCTTTPPPSPSTATTRRPTGSGPCGGSSAWPSPTATTRTTAPTSSNCFTSSRSSRDGAVPVQFRVESGNATDDRSHRGTWESALQADRPPRLPLRRRLQARHRREHGPHPSERRPVPHRPAPHPRRGRDLPRGGPRGPGPLETRSTTSSMTRAN